jgi:hypothetical protein
VVAVAGATSVSAQVIELYAHPPGAQAVATENSRELFGKGLFDFHFSGHLESTAQIVKIRVGEPNGFNAPLYLLAGATSAVSGNSGSIKTTVANLVGPTGGIINAIANIDLPIYKRRDGVTRIRLNALGAGRLVSGEAMATGATTIIPAGYFDGGIVIETAAWLNDVGYQELGTMWLSAKYSATAAADDKFREVFGLASEEPAGIRGEVGIFIKEKVNVKIGVYVARQGKNLPGLDEAAWRMAFDYSVKP